MTNEHSLILKTYMLKLPFDHSKNSFPKSINIDKFNQTEIDQLNCLSIQSLINSSNIEEFKDLESKFGNRFKDLVKILKDPKNLTR